MNKAGQNSAVPPHGLMELVHAADCSGEALRKQGSGAGRAAVSLCFLNTLSGKGFL